MNASCVVVVYAGEEPPPAWHAAAFAAGPMPRDPDSPSWRPEALELFEKQWISEGTLVVFVPEPRDRHHPPADYAHQLWEDRWMSVADALLFWVPRQMPGTPGLTTNVEFGRYEGSGRAVLGVPPHAESVRYLRHFADVNGAPVVETLDGAVAAVLGLVGHGVRREDAARDVPLLVWRTPAFQAWWAVRRGELLGARVRWVSGAEALSWVLDTAVRSPRGTIEKRRLMCLKSSVADAMAVIESPLPAD